MVLILLGTLSCESDPPVKEDERIRPDQTSVKAEDLGGSNLRFGLSLFKTLNEEEEKGNNILISPLSIQTALHMTTNAAAGQSREDFLTGLYLGDWSLKKLNQSQQQWRKEVIKNPSHPTISSTNGFFKDPERIDANPDFTDKLKQYYRAKLMDLDFDQGDQAKAQINKWVKNQTEDKIEKIVDNIRDDDVGFLINALYYRADWKAPFPEEATRDRDFQLLDGEEKTVPFMSRDGEHSFYQGEDYMVLDKPFKGEQFSLTILQPTNEQSILELISGIDPDMVTNVYKQLESSRAIVNLPKMDLAYKEDLLDDLQDPMGFNLSKANISRMGKPLIPGSLEITRIKHKSVLNVDEKGAEGAAVTSVGTSVTSAPPTLTFDQPFMVMLRHIPSNSLLFIGRVMEP